MGGILGGKRSNRMSAKERALWRWVNVEDLDAFLQEVYLYYVGKGIWAIGLSRLLNLLSVRAYSFARFVLTIVQDRWLGHILLDVSAGMYRLLDAVDVASFGRSRFRSLHQSVGRFSPAAEAMLNRSDRFSGLTLILFLSFTSFYLWRVVSFGLGVRKLWEMHEFFGELLEVPEVSFSYILL